MCFKDRTIVMFNLFQMCFKDRVSGVKRGGEEFEEENER
jgi:hypothetical protein